jgi:hypothetical protein
MLYSGSKNYQSKFIFLFKEKRQHKTADEMPPQQQEQKEQQQQHQPHGERVQDTRAYVATKHTYISRQTHTHTCTKL